MDSNEYLCIKSSLINLYLSLKPTNTKVNYF